MNRRQFTSLATTLLILPRVGKTDTLKPLDNASYADWLLRIQQVAEQNAQSRGEQAPDAETLDEVRKRLDKSLYEEGYSRPNPPSFFEVN